MGIALINKGRLDNINALTLYADSVADMNAYPLDDVPVGSACLINDGSGVVFILNTSKIWIAN